jgi:hypothetical protein
MKRNNLGLAAAGTGTFRSSYRIRRTRRTRRARAQKCVSACATATQVQRGPNAVIAHSAAASVETTALHLPTILPRVQLVAVDWELGRGGPVRRAMPLAMRAIGHKAPSRAMRRSLTALCSASRTASSRRNSATSSGQFMNVLSLVEEASAPREPCTRHNPCRSRGFKPGHPAYYPPTGGGVRGLLRRCPLRCRRF